MERIAYHLPLWRKHLLQYFVYSNLNLPEIGLIGGESLGELALWKAAMSSVGIPEQLQQEARKQYQDFDTTKEATIRTLLKKKDTQTGSPYLQASKLCSLFERSAREAGVSDHPDFVTNKEQLFWNTLVDYGIYYDIYGTNYSRDVVSLFRAGGYVKDLMPNPQENRTLLPTEDTEIAPDVAVEIGGYARRMLTMYGSFSLNESGLGRTTAIGRFAFHLFKNFLRFIVGAHMVKLPSEALLQLAFHLAQGTRTIDQEVVSRLEAMIKSERVLTTDDHGLEEQVSSVLLRLKRAEPAIAQTWSDGWVSPEERVLLRYIFPHIFGIGEQAIGRFLSDMESSTKLCEALRKQGN
jgi:hypothetical protein